MPVPRDYGQSMSGNGSYRYGDLSVCGVDAPHVVTSDEIDARLTPTYRRPGVRPVGRGGRRPAASLGRADRGGSG